MSGHAFFSDLFVRYQSELKRFVLRKFGSEDADDIVQDAFMNMMRHEGAHNIENPRAYLYQSAHNLAINRIKRGKKFEDLSAKIVIDEESITLEHTVSSEQELDMVREALSCVPEKFRRTFEMSRLEHKTYQEIADELGISVSTVEKHIIKTLSMLRKSTEVEA